MSHLVEFMESLFTYFKNLLFIDFSNYSGNLPPQVIEMYSYIESFFKFAVVVIFLYMVFNFIIFVVSLGGVRK